MTTADPREPLGRLVCAVWVAAVLELIPDPKPSWVVPWDKLDDAFQREADMRIGAAIASAEHTKSSNAEWLCERCRVIHPPQPGCFLRHPCPQCGATMLPTSPSRRRIDTLTAELAGARARYDVLADYCRLLESKVDALRALTDEMPPLQGAHFAVVETIRRRLLEIVDDPI